MPQYPAHDDQARYLSVAELIALIEPHAGIRLIPRKPSDPPRRVAIDITVPGLRAIDADIRAVSHAGIKRFFYSGCETFPWVDVRKVEFRDTETGAVQTVVPILDAALALQVAA